jgi:acyltransferase
VTTSTSLSPETHGSAPRRTMPDVAKAIGIVLVVMGHAWPKQSLAVHAIYSFHMPLFFIISGMLMTEGKLKSPAADFLSKQFRALIVPYIFFAAISLALWYAGRTFVPSMAAGDRFDADWTLWDGFLGTLYAAGHRVRGVNPSLWFFGAMFFCALYYYVLRRFTNAWQAVIVAGLLCPLAIWLRRQSTDVMPWSLDVAAACVVFYAIGRWIGDWPLEQIVRQDLAAALLFGLALIIGGLSVGLWHDRIDVRTLQMDHIGFFLCAATLSCAGVLVLSALVPGNVICEELSRHALGMFSLHMFAIVATKAVLFRVFRPSSPDGWEAFALTTLAGIATLALCYAASSFLNWAFPWVFRQPSSRSSTPKALRATPTELRPTPQTIADSTIAQTDNSPQQPLRTRSYGNAST